MTIRHRQYFQNVSQQEKILVFECPEERLSEAAPEDQLLKWDATAHQWDATIRREVEDERVCPSEEKPLVEGKVTECGNSLLLMLANSAELMSESEDNALDHEGLGSTTEAQHLQENVKDVMATESDKNSDNVDEMRPIVHERIEKDGSHCGGTVTRLSQIRRQARLRSQSFMQKSIQEDPHRHSQGSKNRLTQIRRLARWGNHVPVQKDISGFSNGKLLGGITRLSQIRHQARSKKNSSLQEGTG